MMEELAAEPPDCFCDMERHIASTSAFDNLNTRTDWYRKGNRMEGQGEFIGDRGEGTCSSRSDDSLKVTTFKDFESDNQKFNFHWPGQKYFLMKSIQNCFDMDAFTDLLIYCERAVVPCHRFVLSSASSMLRKLLADRSVDAIYLPEIPIAAAKAMLTFVYTGKVTIPVDLLGEFMEISKSLEITFQINKSEQNYLKSETRECNGRCESIIAVSLNRLVTSEICNTRKGDSHISKKNSWTGFMKHQDESFDEVSNESRHSGKDADGLNQCNHKISGGMYEPINEENGSSNGSRSNAKPVNLGFSNSVTAGCSAQTVCTAVSDSRHTDIVYPHENYGVITPLGDSESRDSLDFESKASPDIDKKSRASLDPGMESKVSPYSDMEFKELLCSDVESNGFPFSDLELGESSYPDMELHECSYPDMELKEFPCLDLEFQGSSHANKGFKGFKDVDPKSHLHQPSETDPEDSQSPGSKSIAVPDNPIEPKSIPGTKPRSTLFSGSDVPRGEGPKVSSNPVVNFTDLSPANVLPTDTRCSRPGISDSPVRACDLSNLYEGCSVSTSHAPDPCVDHTYDLNVPPDLVFNKSSCGQAISHITIDDVLNFKRNGVNEGSNSVKSQRPNSVDLDSNIMCTNNSTGHFGASTGKVLDAAPQRNEDTFTSAKVRKRNKESKVSEDVIKPKRSLREAKAVLVCPYCDQVQSSQLVLQSHLCKIKRYFCDSSANTHKSSSG